MSATSQEMPTQRASERMHTVVMGRQDFFSVLLRLVGMELYKLRRRTMSKVLSIIALLLVALVFTIVAVFTASYLSTPASDTGSQGTIASDPTSREAIIHSLSQPLRLPDSLTTTGQIIYYVGLALIIILAGAIVGGEYGVGTLRLMLTRGPTRTQYFLSKLGTILAVSTIGTVVLAIVGVGLGFIFNLMTGLSMDFGFLTGAWLLHALLFLLTTILELFVYGTLAACLSTLGKATAAGIAGALLWWLVEVVLGQILMLMAALSKGNIGDFLKTIPDYFIGNNVSALIQNQSRYLLGGNDSAAPISNLHAILIVAIYMIVFIGLAGWVNEHRDVTN